MVPYKALATSKASYVNDGERPVRVVRPERRGVARRDGRSPLRAAGFQGWCEMEVWCVWEGEDAGDRAGASPKAW